MRISRMLRVVMTVAAVVAGAATARAGGLLMPEDKGLPPLAIRYHRVETEIDGQVAVTRVTQAFTNTTDRVLEATYVFPVPGEAGVSSFTMWVDDRKMTGDLVDSGEARRIYEDIVRRMKDPGLLEYWENRLLRMRVYPVPACGEVRVRVEYRQVLAATDRTVEYLYPLRTGHRASATLEDFTLAVRIRSETPIKTVYSPTHELDVTRPSETEAVAGFESDGALLDRDFRLVYDVSDRDIGVSLLAHRRKGGDGTFLLLASPKQEIDDADVLPKDVVFVFDVSGSMKGAKIDQARQALLTCIERLPDRDRFEVIRFSTGVEPAFGELRRADGAAREAAREFVEGIRARGGTAIHDALQAAFASGGTAGNGDRPLFVVFLTDGKPTVGEDEPNRIIDAVRGWNGKMDDRVRLFVFGVGDRVNVHMLDRLSGGNGGLSSYVGEDEEIDREVTRLFSRLDRPVLADLELSISPVEVTEVYPPKLPDLFGGDQLIVVGRYRTSGDGAIRLTGSVHGKRREFVYESTFPDREPGNGYIEEIWATRKVGYLLDQIRLNGEDPELKDEVIQLGREYGIVTPYTSYLALEPTDRARIRGIRGGGAAADATAASGSTTSRYGSMRMDAPRVDRAAVDLAMSREMVAGRRVAGMDDGDGDGIALAPAPAAAASAGKLRQQLYVLGSNAEVRRKGEASVAQTVAVQEERARSNLSVESGAYANTLSEAIQSYRQTRQVQGVDARAVRNIDGRAFYFAEGQWNDEALAVDVKPVRIRFGSAAYFDLVEIAPSLRPAFALGERVLVEQNGIAVQIDPDTGADELTEQQRVDLAD